MSDTVISVENLSKRYRIGTKEEGYKTIREAIIDGFTAPIRNLRRLRKLTKFDSDLPNQLNQLNQSDGSNPSDVIWALRDVSFEVKQGEVVGIIGRNGAGKTTLLKILSRITEPTSGDVKLYGRVSSLLEVGTGFHPELTGRENIYLNGAILGMRKTEIDAKFDEIVDFAEIEKFLDTPVKRYSSGMYVRLAFAVAAHLEPEILVVDEVLAVGDAAFQKKCLGKMGAVAKEGRTVLFVSHNMVAVRNLCSRAIWLKDGSLYRSGDVANVTESYLKESLRAESMDDVPSVIAALPPDPAFHLKSIQIRQEGQPANVILNGTPIEIEICYTVLQQTTGLRVLVDLLDDEQNLLIRTFHDENAETIPVVEPGEYISIATIPAPLLAPRTYDLRVQATIYRVRFCTGNGVDIPLVVEMTSGINRGYVGDPIRSKLQPRIEWSTLRKPQKCDTRE